MFPGIVNFILGWRRRRRRYTSVLQMNLRFTPFGTSLSCGIVDFILRCRRWWYTAVLRRNLKFTPLGISLPRGIDDFTLRCSILGRSLRFRKEVWASGNLWYFGSTCKPAGRIGNSTFTVSRCKLADLRYHLSGRCWIVNQSTYNTHQWAR